MINFKNAKLVMTREGVNAMITEDIIRVQPMMQPTSKVVYVDSFKITREIPSLRTYIDQALILYLEGYYQKKPKSCQCEMAILFRNGCQCGGI